MSFTHPEIAGTGRPIYADWTAGLRGEPLPVSLLARLEGLLNAERGRWFLWLPVFWGCGVAAYLGAAAEPPLSLAFSGLFFAVFLRIFFRNTTFRLVFSSISLLFACGFLTAKLNALIVDAPVLQKDLRYAELTGWIEHREKMDKRARLTIRLISLAGIEPQHMPRRIRISIRGDNAGLTAGTAIKLHAALMPPPEPASPGGFDFARYYWFSGIGASGYSMGKVTLLEDQPAPPLDLRLRAIITNFRHAIGARVAGVLSGTNSAIAQALIMGERGEIPEEANNALRDAGLVHVISISGFHMALTAGTAFWLIRGLLALFPSIALRCPIKVWAAIAALIIASFYLAISGAAITAIRAYIMVAIMFGAIILNRPALSLRNLALAALIILAIMPQSLMDAGFQMSFAATAALIAFYEARPPAPSFAGWPRLIAIPAIFIAEAAATTLFASLAVDPFAAYHFHRIATYSMLGNVLAMPVVSAIVMPMALLALVAMPFGLEAAPLLIMDQGISLMLAIARFVAGLPGATIGIPAFPDIAFVLMVLGGLWLIIWRGRWRYFGLAAIAAGLAMTPLGGHPDVWIEREGKLVAIRDKSGLIATADTRKAKFSLERWMEADGDQRPLKTVRSGKGFQCDDHSCIALVKGKLLSHVRHPAALADDCRRAAILLVDFPLPERCPEPEIVIDIHDLWEKGAHTLHIGADGITADTVMDHRGKRPWVVSRQRRDVIPTISDVKPKSDEPE